MAEPSAPPAQPAGGKSKMWIAIIAIVVVALIAVAAFIVLQVSVPRKYQLELWYNNDGHYGDTEAALAQTLQNSIQTCGKVQVTLKSDPWAVYKQNWANQRMPLFLLGWYPDYFDSDNYVSPFLTTSGAKGLGSYYKNTTVEQWISEEATTIDPAVRADRFAKIQNALADHVPYVPLYTTAAQVAYVNAVQNVELHPVTFKWFIVNKPGATQLTVSTSDKIISLDPASAYDFMSIEVINQVFDTLLVYDWKNGTLVPGLATEVPTFANGGISPNGRNYTFHLKPGITFHNGDQLNSTVVKASIDRAMRLDLAGSAAYLLYDASVSALTPDSKANNSAPGVIETPNAQTIVFHLFQPFYFFNYVMAFSVAAPVPLSYSQTGEQPSTVGNVIGTGPYRLTQHSANTLVELTAVSNYYNANLYASAGIPGIPIMQKVNINIRATATALKQDIETKTVDVVFRTLTPTDLTDLVNRQQQLGITVKRGSGPQIRYLVFNVNKIPDVRVRQAIAYSVDRGAINTIVFNGQAAPLYSMVPSAMPYSVPVFQSRYGDAKCNEANALIAQLGFAAQFHGELLARDV